MVKTFFIGYGILCNQSIYQKKTLMFFIIWFAQTLTKPRVDN